MPLEDVVIPDIWDDMMHLQFDSAKLTKKQAKAISERALEVWHLAHGLLSHIWAEAGIDAGEAMIARISKMTNSLRKDKN